MSHTGQRQGEGTVEKASADGGWKELAIVAGILVALIGGAMGIYWLSTGGSKADATEKNATPPAAAIAPTATAAVRPAAATGAGPVAVTPEMAVTYADIYFDFKSTRLRADSVAVLQDKAQMVKDGDGWVVIVHGYADRQGPAEYNKVLAQRRAQSVKQFLVELGVPEPAVKLVTVGQEGSLCDDPGKECQQLNRRVHIEMRKLAIAMPVRATVTEGDRLLVDQSVAAPTVTKPEAK
jgi:outer membrane protein OmpA-like peptidoglycan-associated protein